MPNFNYTARTKSGKPERGAIRVKSEDELIEILQARGLVVVSFRKAEKKPLKAKSKRQKLHSKITQDDLIVLGRQLTALIKAGITLLRSLEIIVDQVSSKRLQDVLLSIKEDVSGGGSLKDALLKHPKVFSKLWVNIVSTGEATGELASSLEHLCDYLEQSAAFKRKIINSLFYPLAIMLVAICAVVVFVVKIIPMFASIYASFSAQLPAFTQLVFGISEFMRKYIFLEFIFIVGFGFFIKYYRATPYGKRNIDKILLDIPIIGEIIRQVETVRFASQLQMLIKSGTPILHALDITAESSNNVLITDMLNKVKENVKEGKNMSEPLIEEGIFPPMISNMIKVGEESGELVGILDNAVKFYTERIDAYVTRLTALFEPALIVIIGVIVAAIVIAMYLPIFGLSSVIQ